MKDLLITHTDLDGISPIILMNLTNRKFDYKSIEIQDVPEYFKDLFTRDLSIYENIYITDLSLSEDIHKTLITKDLPFKVFDHHETHLFAENYKNVTVKVNYKGHKTCATELFYLYLKEKYSELNTKIVADYVELVRQIDTYTFTTNKPKELAMLMDTFGKPQFIKSVIKRLKKDKEEFEFTSFEKRFLKLKNEELTRYMERMEKKMIKCLIKERKCGVVFAENNKSELGNYLSNKYPDLDLIILIDASSRISYRTSRDDVKVSEFATLFGGGGHAKASGSKFDDNDRFQVIEQYFNDVKRLDVDEN